MWNKTQDLDVLQSARDSLLIKCKEAITQLEKELTEERNKRIQSDKDCREARQQYYKDKELNNQLEQQLDGLWGQQQELNTRKTFLEKENQSLKHQISIMEKDKDRLVNENNILAKNVFDLQSQIAQLMHKGEMNNKQLQNYESSNLMSDLQLSQLQDEHTKLEIEAVKYKEKQEKLRQKLKKVQGQLQQSWDNYKNLEQVANKLREENSQLRGEIRQYQGENRALQMKHGDYQETAASKVREQQVKLQEYESEIQHLKGLQQMHNEQINSIKNDYEIKILDFNYKIQVLQDQLKDEQSINSNLKYEKQQLKDQQDYQQQQLDKRNEEHRKAIQNLTAQNSQYQFQIKQVQDQTKDYVGKIEELKHNLSQSQSLYEEFKQKQDKKRHKYHHHMRKINESHNKRIQELQGLLQEKTCQDQEVQKIQEYYKHQHEKLGLQITQLEKFQLQREEEIVQINQDRQRLRGVITELQQQLIRVKESFEQSQQQCKTTWNEYQTKIFDLQHEVNVLKQDKRSIEQQLLTFKSSDDLQIINSPRDYEHESELIKQAAQEKARVGFLKEKVIKELYRIREGITEIRQSGSIEKVIDILQSIVSRLEFAVENSAYTQQSQKL